MPNLLLVLTAFSTLFMGSTTLRLENLALRQQLGVLRRSRPKRLKLTATDRLFWVWLTRVWTDWRSALMIVQPETVVAWHRKSFRLFWRWKILHGKLGRPTVSREVRDLIRTMSRANPLWGAPRIHGELLKLGIEISEPTVSKYMVRPRKPPSQTWQIFLENHVQNLVSVDFFVVPTIRFQVLYVFLCWLMIGVAFCILGSLLIPRQNGPPSNSGKHFLGTVRLAIYSGIAIGSLAKASGSKSKLWASRKSSRHHGPSGSERTWNG